MHETCEVCGLRFEVEPGFFYGSMYVSYGFSVGIFLATWIGITLLIEDASIWTYIITVVVLAAIAYPFNVRLSRLIMLHAFGGVKYDRSFVKGK
ncbi:MAG: DUF983 domain-containing protein [Cytophagales bacterium]|nr:DUF983 domain-containing protein [Cytophagales bacterium]